MCNHNFMAATHPGIRFPDRAEALASFEGYRVFLDPWEPIANELQSQWTGVALREESGILGIFGPQGAGKTLLTKKLLADFEVTKSSQVGLVVDQNNFWHRVSGGKSLDPELIASGTEKTEFKEVENDRDWVSKAEAFAQSRDRVRARVLLADNAERAYFRQGLVDMTDIEFMKNSRDPELTRLAAERLVDKLRTTLRGTLLIVLSNDDEFLLQLQDAVEHQHEDLMALSTLGLPDSATKETIIRVNTNRLNPASYWSAIDQASETDRLALKQALGGDATFPNSFRAVDTASKNRIGRPARRNVITLVALSPSSTAGYDPAEIGTLKRTDVAHEWMSLTTYHEDWAPDSLGTREKGLLESEWALRVCVLGDAFVGSLLAAGGGDIPQKAQVQSLLSELKTFRGPGTKEPTRVADTARYASMIDLWNLSAYDTSAFWSSGQARSTLYEPALKQVLPGYNTTTSGFLTYRPDFVVNDFSPASVLNSISDDPKAIRQAIRRDAHVFEFTAIESTTSEKINSYLASKLPIYVEITQEQ
jgi:hypothetical protein